MADIDSGVCRVRWPDDAITLLEKLDKATLQAVLEKLDAKSKSGNKDELAVRVAELVETDGAVLRKQLRDAFLKDCLSKLALAKGADAAENASLYAKALRSCLRERNTVSGKPWYLKHLSISKMSHDMLKTLCIQRQIRFTPGQTSSTLVKKLEYWRTNPDISEGEDCDSNEEGEEEVAEEEEGGEEEEAEQEEEAEPQGGSSKDDGKKKKRKKKDKNAPKKAISAYLYYLSDSREKIKANNPGITFGDIGKLAGANWKELSAENKQPYESKAMDDKQRYAKAMQAYKEDGEEDTPLKSPAKKAKPASPAMSAECCRYGAFCRTKGCKYEHRTPALDGHGGLDKLSVVAREDAGKCREMWEQSKAKVMAKLEKFKDTQHIDNVAPVYLGQIRGYANMRKPVTAGKMHKMIQEHFKDMSKNEYEYHLLRDFFEPRKDKQPGYQAKQVKTGIIGQCTETMFDVDHVVPSRWGGIDHPRNMVVMHRSMNRSFQDALPETKWYYIETRSPKCLRQVAEFTKGVYKSEKVQAAVADYIKNDMKAI